MDPAFPLWLPETRATHASQLGPVTDHWLFPCCCPALPELASCGIKHVRGRLHILCGCRPEDNLWKSALSFHHVDSKDGAQATRLSSKRFNC